MRRESQISLASELMGAFEKAVWFADQELLIVNDAQLVCLASSIQPILGRSGRLLRLGGRRLRWQYSEYDMASVSVPPFYREAALVQAQPCLPVQKGPSVGGTAGGRGPTRWRFDFMHHRRSPVSSAIALKRCQSTAAPAFFSLTDALARSLSTAQRQ